MQREPQPFEQDFVLVETEMRVRQATQYTQLDPAILANPHEDIWEWEISDLDGEQFVDIFNRMVGYYPGSTPEHPQRLRVPPRRGLLVAPGGVHGRGRPEGRRDRSRLA